MQAAATSALVQLDTQGLYVEQTLMNVPCLVLASLVHVPTLMVATCVSAWKVTLVAVVRRISMTALRTVVSMEEHVWTKW